MSLKPRCKLPCFKMNKSSSPKIALVHDYLREYGGAERVLEALHELFPDAPVYTAFMDTQALGMHAAKFTGWNIQETWLAKVPGIKKLFSPLRFLAPKAFADLDLSSYDVVISSSNAYFAKAVKVPNGTHYCYCHTPPRALYGYITMSDWRKNPLIRVGGEIINHYLRVIDFQVAQKVDVFIANSQETARRIQKFYRRESVVICPPVGWEKQISQANMPAADNSAFLYVNRLALSKHPEMAVAACLDLELPLKVVGSGPMLAGLHSQVLDWQQLHPKKTADIQFLGAVSDAALQNLYANAKALLYPVEDEDFGMVPVEALLAGTSVIAHNSGGPKETVRPGVNGVLFDEISVTGLKSGIAAWQKLKFDRKKVQASAVQFNQATFKTQLLKLLKLT
jgi:glycosyltransferase involved in cell wall biosynthesis